MTIIKYMPIPTPKSGESKDKFISRCMGSDIMNSEFPDQKQRAGVCYSQWRKKGESMDEMKKPALTYARPISIIESKTEDKKLFIKGVAIDVGISRNNVDYTPNVLRAAAQSLIGKPLMLNHEDHDVRNIVGKVVEAEFDGKNVPFKAEIDKSESWLVNKLQNGYIDKVSIGADTIDENGIHYDPVPDDDGIIRPTGIEFLELSLVPIPGVPNASINQVIAESYNKRVKTMAEKNKMAEQLEELKKKNEELEKKLAEQEEKTDDSSKEEEKSEPEEKTEDRPEEKKEPQENAKVKSLEEKVEKLNEKLSKLIEKPKGVATEMSEKKNVGTSVVIEHNPKGGVDIYNKTDVTERAEPGSGRRFVLY